MPPKKQVVEEKVTLWGRPGQSLKMGIVGLPNVGKSSTFNVMSNLNVPAQNFSFCTIEPNLSRVNVPDDRLEKLCEVHKPKSKVPSTLSIWDIAGLVKGASSGAGLGNNFLSHIKEVDGIYHVVRAFEDEEITHEEVTVDPVRDLEIICDELCLKDIEFLEKRIQEQAGLMKKQTGDQKKIKEVYDLLVKVMENLQNKVWVRCIPDLSPADIEVLNPYCFITAKPVTYLVNLSAKDYIRKKNKWLPKIVAWTKEHVPGVFIPYSAEFEEKCVVPAHKCEKTGIQIAQSMLKEHEGTPSMINTIIKTGFKSLDLEYFFTAGPDEVRAWTIKKFSKAPQAAGRIHGDFERGFICAEVMKYDDFIACGCSQAKVKEEGKYRQQGKEYVVNDGDIIYFKFNVTAKKK